MPSSTFFRLPPEKQEKLLCAARKEFARVPFADASINRIIQEADISRGSFYMYFRDKGELFFYLLDLYAHQLEAPALSALRSRAETPFPPCWIFLTSCRPITACHSGTARLKRWCASCSSTIP